MLWERELLCKRSSDSNFCARCLTSVEVFYEALVVEFDIIWRISRYQMDKLTFYQLGSDLIDFAFRKVCYGTILWNFRWLINFVLVYNMLNMTYKYITPKHRQDLNKNTWRDVAPCLSPTPVVRLFYIVHLFLKFEDHTTFVLNCCIQTLLDF